MKFSVPYENNVVIDWQLMRYRGRKVDGVTLVGHNSRTRMMHFKANVLRFLKYRKDYGYVNDPKNIKLGWM